MSVTHHAVVTLKNNKKLRTSSKDKFATNTIKGSSIYSSKLSEKQKKKLKAAERKRILAGYKEGIIIISISVFILFGLFLIT